MLKLCPACLYDPLLQIRSYIRYKMKEEEASPCEDGIGEGKIWIAVKFSSKILLSARGPRERKRAERAERDGGAKCELFLWKKADLLEKMV